MTGVPLNVDWQQILLHLFNFTILFGALYILLYKPVKDFMYARKTHFAEMDSRAEQTLAEAEDSKAAYESKLKTFNEELAVEKAKASEEIEAEKARRLSAAKDEADKILKDAKKQADREKSNIVASANKEIGKIVREAMEKLALGATEADVLDKFLDAAEDDK